MENLLELCPKFEGIISDIRFCPAPTVLRVKSLNTSLNDFISELGKCLDAAFPILAAFQITAAKIQEAIVDQQKLVLELQVSLVPLRIYFCICVLLCGNSTSYLGLCPTHIQKDFPGWSPAPVIAGSKPGGGHFYGERRNEGCNRDPPLFCWLPFLVADVASPVSTNLDCTITELIQTSKSVKRVCALERTPHSGQKSP